MTNEQEEFDAWRLRFARDMTQDELVMARGAWNARAALATPAPLSDEPVAKLAVWYGSMPESNGKSNWTAILHNGDISRGITLDRSEYPDRVRYEADRVRWLIGELDKEPWILDYDADKHSGYAAPPATPSDKQEASHHWGRDGDRCIKCGDKDWMANESCSQRLIKPSDKQEPFAWMRPDVLDRLKSTIAYSAGTELLKNRKDGYVPIYATPPAPLAQSAEQDFESVWEKARVMDETTKTMARFIWNSARQSAEQDRIDAERWRNARQLQRRPDEYDAYIDRQRAKGASK
ncbi:hypothetical protein [Caballeronia sp. INML2]|uniref:hypothetical protein n=1 Tax=Caballeronia sp. INML2 TaxID=2921748 RepID=UPI002028804B|nr:hypothetical protein [Caballeronia sp. INML2]